MKHLFIINPVAGKYDHTEEIKARLEPYKEEFDLEIAVTTAARDGEDIVRKAAASGEELRVYACGGDGTFNEVASAAVDFENVAVTHVPLGSGNDYIKLFSDGGASFSDIDRLLRDSDEARFDVIRCNDMVGANICSVGIDARIGTEMARYKRLPLVSGSMAYYISTLVNVVKGITEHYVVEVNGRVIDQKFTLICIANGRCYGSTFRPVPEAEPDDGILDVLLVNPVSRLQVAGIIGKYAEGKYRQLGELVEHVQCTEITITADKDMAVNVDGECLVTKKVKMTIVPKALRVFFPKGLDWSGEIVEA